MPHRLKGKTRAEWRDVAQRLWRRARAWRPAPLAEWPRDREW